MKYFLHSFVLTICLSAVGIGCRAPEPGASNSVRKDSYSIQKMSNSNMQANIPALENWTEKVGMSEADLKGWLSPNDGQLGTGRSYGAWNDLIWICNPIQDPGHYYVKDGKVVLVYLEDAPVFSQMTAQELLANLGTPTSAQVLRSRVGKLATQYAYPELGIAFSEERDTVVFVELFAPMTLEQYKAQLYQDPGTFGL